MRKNISYIFDGVLVFRIHKDQIIKKTNNPVKTGTWN